MQWSGHPYLLCEALAESVRQPLALARERRLLVHFDYQGPTPVGRNEAQNVTSLAERLATAAVRNVAGGSATFIAKVSYCSPSDCLLRLQVLTTSPVLSAEADARLQGAASLEESTDAALRSLIAVRALCNAMHGHFSYRAGPAGSVIDAEVVLPCLAPFHETPKDSADGAQAWLLGADPRVHGLLPRRLERMGWTVRLVQDPAHIDLALAERDPANLPALIVVATGTAPMEWIEALRPRVSDQVQLFYVVGDSNTPPVAVPGVNIQRPPFSPRQLSHITHMAFVSGLRPSGSTAWSPLSATNRPRALIVEPNDVSALVLQAELFAAGFDIERIAEARALRGALATGTFDLAVVNVESQIPIAAVESISEHLQRSSAGISPRLIGTCFGAQPPQQLAPFEAVVSSAGELGDRLFRSGAFDTLKLI
jgi:hypothetical protein